MSMLKEASKELFRRREDEVFVSIDSLYSYCKSQRDTTKEVRANADEIAIQEGHDKDGHRCPPSPRYLPCGAAPGGSTKRSKLGPEGLVHNKTKRVG